MQDRRLYEQILDIESPWSVERVELELEAGEVHVHLRHHKNATWPCPECGTVCPLHDHEPTKTWRYLDTCQYRTLLHASVPRTNCSEHGVKVVEVFWAEPHSRFTMLFERLAIAWMQEAARSAVARRMGMSWDQADRIMRQAVERGLARHSSTRSAEKRGVGVSLSDSCGEFDRHVDYKTVTIERQSQSINSRSHNCNTMPR